MNSSKHVSKVTKSTKVAKSTESSAPVHPVQPTESAPPAQIASTSPVTDVSTQAASALADLQKLSSALPLDDALTAKGVKQARGASRIPLQALVIAANVLEENPGRFPDFDATDARAAVTYEQVMVPVATAARELAASIDRSVMNRRSSAADQSLALYATLKGLTRVPVKEKTRSQVKEMGAVLSTRKKHRNTSVTQQETKQLVKVAKSAKVATAKSTEANEAAAAAATAAALAATTAVANGAPSPTPAPLQASASEPVSTAPPVVTTTH